MTAIDGKEMTIQKLTTTNGELTVHYTPHNISDNNIDNHINRCNINTHIITTGEVRLPGQAHRSLEQRTASGALNK